MLIVVCFCSKIKCHLFKLHECAGPESVEEGQWSTSELATLSVCHDVVGWVEFPIDKGLTDRDTFS
jgi:hypothetical protein